MKLLYVASALSLLPASLAFAPASLKNVPQTTTALNGFFDDLFADRVDKLAESKKEVADRFGSSSIFGDNEGEFLVDESQKMKSEFNFKHFPSDKMLGVDLHTARVCATITEQLYDVMDGKIEKFKLNTEDKVTEVLLQEEQGEYRPSNPTFVIAVVDDRMICGWRGTSTLLDGLNDIAVSPASSIVWRKHKKSLKMQGAMLSLCISDIANHEDFIIEECKKRGIKEIVCTGHSLGGGLAQIGHTVMRAQIQDEQSPWSELKDVNVRSLCFSAPMTTVLDDVASKDTKVFMEEINANSVNMIYGNDFVPRSYGYVSFINDFADDVVDWVGDYLTKKKMLTSRVIARKIESIAADQKEKLLDNEQFEGYFSVFFKFVHPGKIIYYKDDDAKPKVLIDMGAFDKNSGKKDTLRSIKYQPKKGVDPIAGMMDKWHGGPPAGMCYDDEFLR